MLRNVFEIFWIFLRLGLTSFGGPIAHLGYFHDEFVKRRQWLDEHAYADLVALCQFLPGPASSQVGMAIGLQRAGILGAIAAWIGFTLPSAIILVLFALGISNLSSGLDTGWLHALKVAAVAVVAQAIWGMSIKLCPDKERISIAVIAAICVSLLPSGWMQIGAIALGGVAGMIFLRNLTTVPMTPMQMPLSKKSGAFFLGLFFILLIGLPLLAQTSQMHEIKLFDSFYRAGSLVFGGGHVVLPLLQKEVVPTGLVSNNLFMAGYGMAQAIPGPLFAFTAYLGAIANVPPNGWAGAGLCLFAAFLPAFLLVFGAIPFWEKLRERKHMRYAMLGINAAVVGILLAAFYHPVWTSAIGNAKDFSLALFGFVLLTFWRTPSWAVVLLSAAVGAAFM
ncbi:chromate efflux transporter [Bdellovibrio sp. NC01]|uniref:chromate efflux transporter n=1 Tax=Bdellovibrio sp. NC01 TaxID=2220073 RepID=UPI001158ACC5|nr:chromate efflux transporter [Bdellovibrio sp. NC01]QDK38457.1 chromate transporter [Bdellovibrio sp. NC01]